MLDNMQLLTKRQLYGLHIKTLKALRRSVHWETCDALGGYNSTGCHELYNEERRRKKRKK